MTFAEGGGHMLSSPPTCTSPLLGEAGRGCGSHDIVAQLPPSLIPPHKGEGVDWVIWAAHHG